MKNKVSFLLLLLLVCAAASSCRSGTDFGGDAAALAAGYALITTRPTAPPKPTPTPASTPETFNNEPVNEDFGPAWDGAEYSLSVGDNGRITATCTVVIGEGWTRPYLFTLYGSACQDDNCNAGAYHATTIEVRDTLTTFLIYDDVFQTDSPVQGLGFRVVDLNGDGFRDIMFIDSYSDPDNSISYRAYLWDNVLQYYFRDKSFEFIPNATWDPSTDSILSAHILEPGVTRYAVYNYVNETFDVTAELYVSFLPSGESGEDAWEYVETRGGKEIHWPKITAGSEPDGFYETFGIGSFWDLRSTKWYDGDYYGGVCPWLDKRYVTFWTDSIDPNAGYGAYYDLRGSSFFVYGCATNDESSAVRYAEGSWELSEGELTLWVSSRIVRLDDGQEVFEMFEFPDMVVLDVGEPVYDSVLGMYVVTIDGADYYDRYGLLPALSGK